MSTRSFISKLNTDGTITGIYCHHDGYPNGVGKMLNENYTNPDKIKALFGLGDLSSLGPGINNGTVAYARDRHEKFKLPVTYASLNEMREIVWNELGVEYSYVWNGENWECYDLFHDRQ